MIQFLLKKSFFDIWDNLFRVMIMNLGFILTCAVLVVFPVALKTSSILVLSLSIVPGIVLFFLWAGALSPLLFDISEYRAPSFKMLASGFSATWRISLILGLISSAVFLAFMIVLPFYFSISRLFGYVCGVFVFWLCIFWILTVQWVLPVFVRMNGSVKTSFKKAFIIALDNPFFTIFCALWSTLLLALSVILILIIPGITSILMLHQNALKLRLYKYDWLEEHPAAPKGRIPWAELLQYDKETVGPRSLKNMIFPWKY